MRLRSSIAVALAALGLFALVGCGGSSKSGNGIASKSAEQIVAEAKNAADSASSVHVSGSVRSGGSPVTLDLKLASEKGATGQISQNGSTFKIVIYGGTAYISGSDAFYRKLGGSAAAQLLAGKWLKVATDTPEFSSFASLTNMRKLLDTVLVGHGTLEKGATTTIAGQQAIAVKDTTRGGTLYAADRQERLGSRHDQLRQVGRAGRDLSAGQLGRSERTEGADRGALTGASQQGYLSAGCPSLIIARAARRPPGASARASSASLAACGRTRRDGAARSR
jgi:hypothetical protein